MLLSKQMRHAILSGVYSRMRILICACSAGSLLCQFLISFCSAVSVARLPLLAFVLSLLVRRLRCVYLLSIFEVAMSTRSVARLVKLVLCTRCSWATEESKLYTITLNGPSLSVIYLLQAAAGMLSVMPKFISNKGIQPMKTKWPARKVGVLHTEGSQSDLYRFCIL